MSFDVVLVAISTKIQTCLESIQVFTLRRRNNEFFRLSCGSKSGRRYLILYKGLEILLRQMNLALASSVFANKVSEFGLISLLLYGSIHNSGSNILLFFFVSNAGAFIARIMIICLPYAKIHVSSKEFTESPNMVCATVLERKTLSACRPLSLCSARFYKITYGSVFNYILFVTSYTLLVIQSTV
jgi:hypothetical protein